jgi:hypothetical protein
MPWRDWQFWIVSLAALLALWYIVRRSTHALRRTTGKASTSVKARLTVSGKALPNSAGKRAE